MLRKYYYYKRNDKKNKRDAVFNSLWIYKLINNIKGHTPMAKAERVVYSTLALLKRYYKVSVPLIIYKFFKTQKILFKITKVRVAGRIYMLPISFNEYNRYSMLSRQTVKQIRLQHNNTFTNKFFEIINSNILIQQSSTTKHRQETYTTVTSFRGYLHYRWRV